MFAQACTTWHSITTPKLHRWQHSLRRHPLSDSSQCWRWTRVLGTCVRSQCLPDESSAWRLSAWRCVDGTGAEEFLPVYRTSAPVSRSAGDISEKAAQSFHLRLSLLPVL